MHNRAQHERCQNLQPARGARRYRQRQSTRERWSVAMAPFCGRTGRPGVALDVGAKLQPCTALPSLVEVTSSAPLFPQPGPHPQSSFVFFQIPMHRMLLASSRIDATACLDCRAHCQARQLGVRVVLPECQAAILWTAYRYPAPALPGFLSEQVPVPLPILMGLEKRQKKSLQT